VISSHWEGLPMAVLEAMMAGLPVVATAVGDLPRVVNHDTGVLVPAGNPARLAEAISCFLTDPIRRRIAGVAAREHAMQNYSINAWFDRLLEVFLAASQRKATL
jgi:glycosyltransferase involved in cell wall biosynthesis